jgi:hypothetical protein
MDAPKLHPLQSRIQRTPLREAFDAIRDVDKPRKLLLKGMSRFVGGLHDARQRAFYRWRLNTLGEQMRVQKRDSGVARGSDKVDGMRAILLRLGFNSIAKDAADKLKTKNAILKMMYIYKPSLLFSFNHWKDRAGLLH